MTADGNYSPFATVRGVLVEFTEASDPLELRFEFNPSTLSRTRSVTIRTGGAPGTVGGYDFADQSEVPRASQGVTVQPETMTMKILLDATDRMNAGDETASQFGVQPEIDILRAMLEPKAQGPEGARTLAALGSAEPRAFARQQFASVLLFRWGAVELPVFMTQARVDGKEFLPSLYPYRAEATLTLQVIESQNPIYEKEVKRLSASASDRAAAIRKG